LLYLNLTPSHLAVQPSGFFHAPEAQWTVTSRCPFVGKFPFPRVYEGLGA
jgi:hypothetical protein